MRHELDLMIEQKSQELFNEKLVRVLTIIAEDIVELKGLVTDITKILEDQE